MSEGEQKEKRKEQTEMKRFLSILLALAVGFTFTFGSAMSAFAATSDNIAAAQDYVNKSLESATSQIVLGTDYSQEAIAYATEEGKKAGQLILLELADKTGYELDTKAGMDAFKAEFYKWAFDTDTPTAIGTDNLASFGTEYKTYFDGKVQSKDVEVKLAEAIAKIKAIDTTVFSLQTYTNSGVDYTYKSYAEKLIADCVETLEADDLFEATDNYTTKLGKITDPLYGTGTEKAPADNSLYHDLYVEVYGPLTTPGLLTVEQEAGLNAGGTVDKDYAKADFAYFLKVTTYNAWKAAEGTSAATKYSTDPWDTTTELGDVDVYDAGNKLVFGVKVADTAELTAAEAAAINAVIMGLLDETITVSNVYFDELEVKAVGAGGTYATALAALKDDADATVNNALNAKADFAEVEKDAEDMKNTYMFDGSKMYNDAEIDAAVAKDKADIYAGFMTALFTAADYLGKVVPATDPVANALAEAIAKFADAMVLTGADKTAEADKKYCKDYYDTVYFGADYDEIKADAIAELEEVKTIDEINAIMADADAKLAKLRTKAEKDAIVADDYKKYETAIKNYSEKVMTGIKGNVDYREASFNAIVTDYIGKKAGMPTNNHLANAGKIDLARNLDEVKALYEEAKAAIDNVVSDKELKAEAQKVSDAIAALPVVDSGLANEDKFMAVYDAYKAYLAMPGTAKADIMGYLVFEAKINDLKGYQIASVTKAIEAFPATITLNDKNTVEAARAAYDKYADYYAQYDEAFNVATSGKIAEAEADIYRAEADAVRNIILQLTDNSTEAEIKAAREAYEALTGGQQRAVKGDLGAFAYKLEMLEDGLKLTEDDVKAALQGLKVKVTATKNSKGNVKLAASILDRATGEAVDFTAIADAGYVVKYGFYKATKKSGTFKKMTAKDETTMVSTSGKKGQKLYYKVKVLVYDAEGNFVAQTYSSDSNTPSVTK